MTPIFNLFIIIPVINILLLAINFILAPHKPYKEKKTPFECGYHSFLSQNRTQFTISFFLFGLLYLMFDIEIVIIYPISVSSYFNGGFGTSVVILFVLVLALGFVFELGKGALKIDSKQGRIPLYSCSFPIKRLGPFVGDVSMSMERWYWSSNAKDIGTLYLMFSLFAGLVGTAFSVLIRIELSAPDVQYIGDNQLYNSIITAHAIFMLFFMVMPAIFALYLPGISILLRVINFITIILYLVVRAIEVIFGIDYALVDIFTQIVLSVYDFCSKLNALYVIVKISCSAAFQIVLLIISFVLCSPWCLNLISYDSFGTLVTILLFVSYAYGLYNKSNTSNWMYNLVGLFLILLFLGCFWSVVWFSVSGIHVSFGLLLSSLVSLNCTFDVQKDIDNLFLDEGAVNIFTLNGKFAESVVFM